MNLINSTFIRKNLNKIFFKETPYKHFKILSPHVDYLMCIILNTEQNFTLDELLIDIFKFDNLYLFKEWLKLEKLNEENINLIFKHNCPNIKKSYFDNFTINNEIKISNTVCLLTSERNRFVCFPTIENIKFLISIGDIKSLRKLDKLNILNILTRIDKRNIIFMKPNSDNIKGFIECIEFLYDKFPKSYENIIYNFDYFFSLKFIKKVLLNSNAKDKYDNILNCICNIQLNFNSNKIIKIIDFLLKEIKLDKNYYYSAVKSKLSVKVLKYIESKIDVTTLDSISLIESLNSIFYRYQSYSKIKYILNKLIEIEQISENKILPKLNNITLDFKASLNVIKFLKLNNISISKESLESILLNSNSLKKIKYIIEVIGYNLKDITYLVHKFSKRTQLAIVKYLYDKELIFTEIVIMDILVSGSLKCLKFFISKGFVLYNRSLYINMFPDCMSYIFKNDNIKLVKFLYENKFEFINTDMLLCSKMNNLRTYNYLASKGIKSFIEGQCSISTLEMFKLYINLFYVPYRDTLECLISSNCPEKIIWLNNKGKLVTDKFTKQYLPNNFITYVIQRYKNIEILKILKIIGFEYSINDLIKAIELKRLDIIEYLINDGCPYNESIIFAAIKTENIVILKYLIEAGCPINFDKLIKLDYKENETLNCKEMIEYINDLLINNK